jgi:hypothetical protein
MVNLPLMFLDSFCLALVWARPDSLNTLTTVATQLQTVVGSAMSHPIWAIATLLLAIVLIQMVADLVKRVLKAGLAFVIKLPLLLSQWVWKKATARTKQPQVPSLARSKAEQIEQLLSRLESLREEQDQVVADLKILLCAPKNESQSKSQSKAVEKRLAPIQLAAKDPI